MKKSILALAVLVPVYCWALFSDPSEEQEKNLFSIRMAEILAATPTPTPAQTTKTTTATRTPTATPSPTPTRVP